VIKIPQLNRFSELEGAPRFFIFGYHSLKYIFYTYSSEEKLIEALDTRSIFIFPFSVVHTYVNSSKVKQTPKHSDFVQLIESKANKIYNKEQEMWTTRDMSGTLGPGSLCDLAYGCVVPKSVKLTISESKSLLVLNASSSVS
jgi:hypothetical protein